MKKLIAISVIIPTKNRADILKKALESLVRQSFDNQSYEVIVCDNNSTDHTYEVANSFKDLFPKFKYFKVVKPGLHEGRHKGLKEAAGKILSYIDDDVEVYPNWLSTIYSIFQTNNDITLLGGKNLPNYESEPPFWLKQMWNNFHSDGHRMLGELSLIDLGSEEREISPFYVFGCNFSIRREILEEAGGFNPDGMPFDLVRFRGDGESYVSRFVQNANYKAYYHPEASVFHFIPNSRMTLDYFTERRYNQGISDAFTYLRYSSRIEEYKKSSSRKFFVCLKNFIKHIILYKHLEELRRISRILDETNFSRELRVSYSKGYKYLIKCYGFDKEVREWVHKENYL